MYNILFQNLAKLFYLDSSVLIWDGNLVKGAADIQAFLDKLPTSVTEICSLDAQPILCKEISLYCYRNNHGCMLSLNFLCKIKAST